MTSGSIFATHLSIQICGCLLPPVTDLALWMHLWQLFDADTYTYTYVVGDRSSGEAALIDPVIDQAVRDLQVVTDLGLKLKYAG